MKEAEERKRKAEQRKRVKRMLEAAFDGDLDEINTIVKEVRSTCYELSNEAHHRAPAVTCDFILSKIMISGFLSAQFQFQL